MKHFKVVMVDEKRKWWQYLLAPTLFLVFVIGAFFVGTRVGRSPTSPLVTAEIAVPDINLTDRDQASSIKDVNFNLYWEVWKRLQTKHISKPVSDGALFYGSLSGLAASLDDPYTVFLPPQKAERFAQDLAGSFSGIGAEIGVKGGIIVVIAPLPDSPAEKAGLQAGDKIFKINNEETATMTLDDAVNKIRGPQGSTVKLSIIRDGFSEAKEFNIVRDVIKIKSVSWKTLSSKPGGQENVGYIKISHFNEDTAEGFEQAVRALTAKNVDQLVLDLRNNPGGFLDTAVRVASEWIKNGPVVIEKFSDGRIEKYLRNGHSRLAGLKTVVLVNQGSASGSEIVAGALQDYGQATIVGEKTFGKGSVQELETLPDGSAVKLTVAKWYTPQGLSIDEHGIAPDIDIDRTDEDYDNDRDPQLDAAIKFLHGEKVESKKEVK